MENKTKLDMIKCRLESLVYPEEINQEILELLSDIKKDLEALEIVKKYLHIINKLWHGWPYQSLEFKKKQGEKYIIISDINACVDKEMEADLKLLKGWLNNDK